MNTFNALTCRFNRANCQLTNEPRRVLQGATATHLFAIANLLNPVSTQVRLIKCIHIFFFILFFASYSFAGDGTGGAQFLKIDVGARAVGMGGAYTGISDDGLGVNWNPGGLVQIKSREINLMYNRYLQDTNCQYVSYVQPGKNSSFGGSIFYLSNSEIQGYDNSGAETKVLSYSDTLAVFSYARKLTNQLDAGVNLKYVGENIAGLSAAAFCGDLGLLYRPEKINNLSLGLNIQNLGSAIKFINESNSLPMNIKLGLGYKLPEKNLLMALDYAQPNDNQGTIAMGLEYWLTKIIGLRVGYKSANGEDAGGGVRFGFGVSNKNIGIDYAFAPFSALGDTHQLGLKIKFKTPERFPEPPSKKRFPAPPSKSKFPVPPGRNK